jgi:hypothetical protein
MPRRKDPRIPDAVLNQLLAGGDPVMARRAITPVRCGCGPALRALSCR